MMQRTLETGSWGSGDAIGMWRARWWDSGGVLRWLRALRTWWVQVCACLEPDPAPQLAETFSQFGCFSRDLF